VDDNSHMPHFVKTIMRGFGADRQGRKDDSYNGSERRENLFGPKGAAILCKAAGPAA
jgi:hypothetical protein